MQPATFALPPHSVTLVPIWLSQYHRTVSYCPRVCTFVCIECASVYVCMYAYEWMEIFVCTRMCVQVGIWCYILKGMGTHLHHGHIVAHIPLLITYFTLTHVYNSQAPVSCLHSAFVVILFIASLFPFSPTSFLNPTPQATNDAFWRANPVWSQCEFPVWVTWPVMCLSCHNLKNGHDLPQVTHRHTCTNEDVLCCCMLHMYTFYNFAFM